MKNTTSTVSALELVSCRPAETHSSHHSLPEQESQFHAAGVQTAAGQTRKPYEFVEGTGVLPMMPCIAKKVIRPRW